MCRRKLLLVILWAVFPRTESSNLEISDEGTRFRQNNTECLTDTMKIAVGLGNKELWALKILDASSKLPSGLLTGHLTDYGNYDECLDGQGDQQNKISTQFCFVNFYADTGNVSLPPLRLAYCLPASCSPQVVHDIVQDVVKDLTKNVTIGSCDCTTRRERSLTGEDYVGISIWGLFLCLVALSTTYDVTCQVMNTEISMATNDMTHLNLNGAKLLNTNRTTSLNTMAPIHGLRFLSICWVVLGHRLLFTISTSLLNLTDFVQELNKLYAQIFIQGVLAVDTFFLLSGLLNCYHLLVLLDKTQRFPVVAYYVHRYIRLTPVLAAIVLMYATWYVLIGDGPNWTPTTQPWKELCVQHWWSTLLYINNYYNPTSQCAGQSWYLAVDMQLYWLTPLVVLPFWKWPRFRKIGLSLLLASSALVVFLIAYIYEFRAPFNLGLDGFDEFLRTTRLMYVPTHTRASPYIIGIMLGYYLHFLNKTKNRLVLSKMLIILGWLTSTAVSFGVLLGNYQFVRPLEDHPYNRVESALYIALHRVGWSLAISWIIISCLNGMGGMVNRILCWKAFVPLSRLTYCIFLSHMAIQQYQIGTARTSDYFQHFNQVHRYFGDLVTAIIVAAGLSLTFESPILVLEKLLLTTKKTTIRTSEGKTNKGYEDDSVRIDAGDRSLAP